MAELPKPPSLDMESEEELELEPILTGETGDTALPAKTPIEVPRTSKPTGAIPETPEKTKPAETTLDGLEPIDLHESGPVDLPSLKKAVPSAKLPAAPSVPQPTAEPDSAPTAAKTHAPAEPKSPYKPVPIPEDPDAPRDIPPPTITGGESRFEVGQRATPPSKGPATTNTVPRPRVAPATQRPEGPSAVASSHLHHGQTDEVPSALLNPTSVVTGASAALTPPPSPGLADTPRTGTPAVAEEPDAGPDSVTDADGFGDTMLDVQSALPRQGLADASSHELGGSTDELTRETHHDITARTEDATAETLDEVLHQSTEQALRLANVVGDVEKLGGSVDTLRTQMASALNDVNASIQALQATNARPVTVSGQNAVTDVERLRDAMAQRLEELEADTARKLKRQSTFQTVQVILLLAVLIALAMLIVRTPRAPALSEAPPRGANPVADPEPIEESEESEESEEIEEIEEIADDPPLEPVEALEGEPPVTPDGRPVPIGVEDGSDDRRQNGKKKRRRRKKLPNP